MSSPLTIQGTTFNYPVSGEDPNWATEATGWAIAVTDALNTLLAPGDILQTTFTIANNNTAASNINGLTFDSGTVRAASVDYSIYRTSTSNPAGHAEFGNIFLVYDDSAASGNKWKLSQTIDGGAGVSLTILDSGQIQYTSTDIGSTGYSGTMKFKARVLSK